MNLFTFLHRIKKPNKIHSTRDKIKSQMIILQQLIFTSPFKFTECRTPMLYLATTGLEPGQPWGQSREGRQVSCSDGL